MYRTAFTTAGAAALLSAAALTAAPAQGAPTTPPADSCWKLSAGQLGSYTLNPATARQVNCASPHNFQVIATMQRPGKFAGQPTKSSAVRQWAAAACTTKILAVTGGKASHLNLTNTYDLKGAPDTTICGVSATNPRGSLTTTTGTILNKTLTDSCYMKNGGFRVPCKPGRYQVTGIAKLYGPKWYGHTFPGKRAVVNRSKTLAATQHLTYDRAFGPFDPVTWSNDSLYVYYTRKI